MIFLLLWTKGYLPLHREADALSQQRQQLAAEIERLDEEVRRAQAAALRLRRKAVPSERRILGELLSPGDSTDRVTRALGDLYRIAELAGVDLKTVRLSDRLDHSDLTGYPVEMSLEGGFEQVGSFFFQLEGLPRVWQVRSLRVEADPERSGWIQVQMQIEVIWGKNPRGQGEGGAV